ncbi:MAG: isoleucine--tRNA ligase [Clostridiales bacterium]|nr:isoleucine--tRNA ligase [Clostridiales bacterium]
MYEKVSTNMNFVEREKKTEQFWRENDIFRKSMENRKDCETYTFYDGPPTANGKPHIGHVLTRVIKDMIPRYQTMKGKMVPRKAGWDTHGLPVELEVERKLGLDGKEQIEEYGMEPFIRECKESVWKYKGMWEDFSNTVGFWADMDDPYVTYDDDFIESEWWALNQIWNKGLLYKGFKIVPYCPRCGTPLSTAEVSQGYRTVKERSAIVRFKAVGEDAYFLAWTTTPWTLPSNLALCVNPDDTYVKVKAGDGYTYYMAEALLDTVLGRFAAKDADRRQADAAANRQAADGQADAVTDRQAADEDTDTATQNRDMAEKGYEILDTFQGSDLEYREYEPLFVCAKEAADRQGKKAFFVTCDSYVTMLDGTGIVHIAPAFGEDDAKVGRSYDLPFVQFVTGKGTMTDETPYAGVFVKKADPMIIRDLDAEGKLFDAPKFEHEYPHCWRCDTPLIYYARESWYIRETAVRDDLIRNNNTVNWIPESIGKGRFGNWLENIQDWAISRNRYWGTPLNIWECECGHQESIGSRAELAEKSGDPEAAKVELHRPYIDAVTIPCPCCGKQMHRVPEVIDCWFDSGAMPFAQHHYPFENKDLFEKQFPAQFISEAVDQTRGWFHSLMAESTLLFNRAPYENVIVLGHVQDENGQKMSKSKGNAVDPFEALKAYGADAIRWYFYINSAPWLPNRFHGKAVQEGQRKFMGTLWNTYAFFVLYANIDEFDATKYTLEYEKLSVMDKWLLSRLNSTVQNVDDHLGHYRIPEAARELQAFVDDMSNWYVRRGRERYWAKGMEQDKINAYMTLYTALVTISKAAAPMVPFMTEDIYRNLVCNIDPEAPESIHLCDFPASDASRIDPELEKYMDEALKIVVLGRAARNASGLKNRQPVGEMLVQSASVLPGYFTDIIADELNVKKVTFRDDVSEYTSYEFKPQLRTVGPKYGRYLGQIKAALASIDGRAAYTELKQNGSIVLTDVGENIILTEDDLLISVAQTEGYATESGSDVTVVLDTRLTPELIEEGLVREIVSKIQTMRKEAGFEVMDQITVICQADPEICAVFAAHREDMMKDVLATDMRAVAPVCNQGKMSKDVPAAKTRSVDSAGGQKETPAGYQKEWNINGHKVMLGVEKND